MKQLSVLVMSLFVVTAVAQDPVEKEVKSDVGAVTVYLEGAQETRSVSVDVPAGKTLLKFVGLSPYIDAKSVQVKADGKLTVLTVNHQQNFLVKPEKSDEYKRMEAQLKEVQSTIRLQETHLAIIQQDLEFLNENRNLGGKDQSLSITLLKEGADFYSQRLTTLKLKEIERRNILEDLYKQENALQNELSAFSSKKEFATGEVSVVVDARQPVKTSFELTYLVSNAGWYPSYDIRADNISEPIEIAYKANIRQDTKGDWKNVKLKLSSYNPSVSGVAPELKTYFLGYNTRPPVYGKVISSVSGRVCNSNNEPLVGVSVRVDDGNLGTVTNAQGSYTLTLPSNAVQLNFSYLGYKPRTMNISGSVLNVVLEEDDAVLEEVMLKSAAFEGVQVSTVDQALQGRVAGLDVSKKAVRIRGTSSIPVPQQQVEKQISVDFEIKTPYTVKTDNNVVSVDMAVMSLPADFQYYCVPKVSKNVFLTARLMDWEQYSFLEGEANVFFEDTYVGKTILNVNTATDTLSISLGQDKKISVQREKVKAYTTKQFIGSKKEETRTWKTTVRNNRNEPVNLSLVDQVPVSQNEEIEVSHQASSGAAFNAETGEINWNIKLEPAKTLELDLKYVVKYPKNKFLVIE